MASELFHQFHEVSLEDFDVVSDNQQRALDIISHYIMYMDIARQKAKGLTVIGPPGVGKTMMTSFVLREAKERRYRIESISFSHYLSLFSAKYDAMNLVRQGDEEAIDRWHALDKRIRRILGTYRRPLDWVLFDDVGKEYQMPSEWNVVQLSDALRTRYEMGLPFLLTSNLPVTEWVSRYSNSLVSIVSEATTVIALTGEDYRTRDSDLPWDPESKSYQWNTGN